MTSRGHFPPQPLQDYMKNLIDSLSDEGGLQMAHICTLIMQGGDLAELLLPTPHRLLSWKAEGSFQLQHQTKFLAQT